MKGKIFITKCFVTILLTSLILISCRPVPEKKSLKFSYYPNLKLGFSTQNFLNSIPFNVEGLTEIMGYASKEGYQFVEIRDQFVDLSVEDCRQLAEIARQYQLEVIYVFNKNPLDPEFKTFFEKALSNVLVFTGPGILRALASKSEFDADPSKKGWSKPELIRLAGISDSCAMVCKAKNIQFVFENSNEPFFGDSLTFYGLADLFANTTTVGLQLDIANLFRKTIRVPTDPVKVEEYLPDLGSRWIETHLKTVSEGEVQPVLTDNPLPVEKIIDMMGRQNVIYAALELTALEDKQKCIDNHTLSVQFLKDKGILKE